eukprot:scpid74113/ scgid33071/ 
MLMLPRRLRETPSASSAITDTPAKTSESSAETALLNESTTLTRRAIPRAAASPPTAIVRGWLWKYTLASARDWDTKQEIVCTGCKRSKAIVNQRSASWHGGGCKKPAGSSIP